MLQKIILKTLILAIQTYRVTVSYLVGGACRFYPTCSAYAIQAIEEFGPYQGSWLCCKRLLRCHPWCCGGYDPVPTKQREF